ncbi:MAG TPA: potassium-transporting ATPase subunit KdpA [Tepidisphaeraceae bacterium]|nr:potassium-transporting ATPase subunit KdpA [Tepidisphaeraceae bacterium]
MTSDTILQIVLYLAVLLLLVKPLGAYMARVYEGKPLWLDKPLGWLERLIYRCCGISADEEMDWKAYALAVLVLNALGLLFVYGLQRMQHALPLNPEQQAAVSPDSSFNTAVSFATNTNWQGYGGETTMSYLTQMLGLTVQNFLSAATGMAVLIALIRGLVRRRASTLGSFWVDLTRGTLYILLPLSSLLAVVLVSQGVVQRFSNYQTVHLLQPTKNAAGKMVTEQVLAVGPVASQEAIKQLGTNGGGFFNVNSAHPFENPTPLSNFLEMLAILLIPAALCYTFGQMVGDTRQGWAILAAMTLILAPLMFACVAAEQAGNPALAKLNVDQNASPLQSGGNMEGKELQFGVVNSGVWAAATTAASNGSVNSMHDSFTPLGGLVPMWLMQLGEVVFGGVGSGLYGMLIFAIIAVFVAGLMVGRTPEYLGKKIESYEMKMASLIILIPPCIVLFGTAIACLAPGGLFNADGSSRLTNSGPHAFSEILYAMSSMGNNNGSAFAGLSANNVFYNLSGGLLMLVSRYWLIVPTLAIAGALVKKKHIPTGPGTLATDTPLFVGFLVAVVILVGALTFIPALALGPVVEHLMR